MYSPKIKEELIPTLYKEAKNKGEPMTKLVNDIIKDYLLKVKCRNCQTEIIIDEITDQAYCPKCESLVFVERRHNAKNTGKR